MVKTNIQQIPKDISSNSGTASNTRLYRQTEPMLFTRDCNAGVHLDVHHLHYCPDENQTSNRS